MFITKKAYDTAIREAVEKALLEQLVSKHPIDAKPVVHGEWIAYGDEPFDNRYTCTACGVTSQIKTVMYKPDANYCPHCGADMGGDKDV